MRVAVAATRMCGCGQKRYTRAGWFPAKLISIYGLNLGPATGTYPVPDAAGFRSAAAINQDGTLNSATNPAPSGSYVSIWTTGTGYFPGLDGQIATAADQFCSALTLECQVGESSGFPFLSGVPVTVSYSGAAPDLVNGVVQVNFQVNSSAEFGYYLSVDGIDSNSFVIYTSP